MYHILVNLRKVAPESPRFWRDGLWQFAPLLLGETHTGFHASEVPF